LVNSHQPRIKDTAKYNIKRRVKTVKCPAYLHKLEETADQLLTSASASDLGTGQATTTIQSKLMK